MTHAQKREKRIEVVEKARNGATLQSLGEEYPYFSHQYICSFCRDYGVVFPSSKRPIPTAEEKQRIRKNGRENTEKHWAGVDWDKRDVDISNERGVTRERVRQVRRKLEKQEAKYKWKGSKAIAFLEWAQANLEKIRGKSAIEIADTDNALGMRPETISKILERIGVTLPSYEPKTLEEIIDRKTVDPETGCWHCELKPSHNGHIRMPATGQYTENVRIPVKYVRNLVYEQAVGYVPHGMCLVNDCGDITCINPAHQHAGEHSEVFKRRKSECLTLADSEAIERLYREGMSVTDIIATVGRPWNTVSKVLRREGWKAAMHRRDNIVQFVASRNGSSMGSIISAFKEIKAAYVSALVARECRIGTFVRKNRMMFISEHYEAHKKTPDTIMNHGRENNDNQGQQIVSQAAV